MALPPILQAPRQGSAVVDAKGIARNDWYEFFRQLVAYLGQSGVDPAVIADILARLDALEADQLGPFLILGPLSVAVQGTPQNGNVLVQLVNDEASPAVNYQYSTDILGVKGWHRATDLTIYLTDPDGNYLTDPDGNLLTDGPNDNHNALNNRQGGSDGESYHLTRSEHDDLAALAALAPGIPVHTGTDTWATATPILNVDFTNSRVGVNTTAPNRTMHVVGPDGAVAVFPPVIGVRNINVLENNNNCTLALVGGDTGLVGLSFLRSGDTLQRGGLTYNMVNDSWVVNAANANVAGWSSTAYAPSSNGTYDNGAATNHWGGTYTHNLILGPAAPSLGGGSGVAFIGNATTVPTTTPTGGGIGWSTGGSLRYSTPGGNVATVVSNAPSMQMVYSLADLPTAVAGVITLANNVEYRFGAAIDLAGARIVCGTNNVLSGRSFSSSSLTSTGLAGGANLITSTSSLKLEDIALSAPTGTLFALNNGATGNLLITGVAILSTPTIGTVQNYGNIVIENTIVQASANWTIGGTVGSFATFRTLLGGLAGQTTLTFPSTLTITRRISILYSVVDTPATGTGINASTTMTIPDENYVLDNTVFSGAGTPIAGLDYTSNKSAFFKNVGIQNSGALCQYSMTGNATATVIGATGTFVKVGGTTTASSFNQKFSTATTQRGTYTGAGTNLFRVAVTASMTSGNNQLLRMRIAKNGTTLTESNSLFRTTGSGEASAVPAQTFVQLAPTDYVEVFVTNDTAATNITVSDLNVTIVRQD